MAAAALTGALLPADAGAVTLRQYFSELSDRDRGVYLTGLLDLMRGDPHREAGLLECLKREGSGGMHAALTDMVHQDPRILDFEVAPWFLYAAGRLCPQEGVEGRRPDEPNATGADLPTPSMLQPSWPRLALAGAVGVAAGVAGALLFRRRRRSAPALEERP